ncbi:dienelactone hydrolase family protein [Actinomarinicola tropica]|uniref:Alpha/beta hydrolase n=1 Tax=Actinomarinicola tropica TaxID=2789776 RepID=A0A5Q2RH58_9ACTN|nr:dienelactone hydrolase family protein [Actinomarinicola tropica]QGG95083.1 alpha/beta hydrolase [Actinomarinicola tropica]
MDAGGPTGDAPGPLAALGTMAATEVALTDALDHIEMYTREGLLTLLWHGEADRRDVVLMAGGAMGGLLGPGRGLYQRLGVELATQGLGVIRVGYRVPNDLDLCVLDVLAAAELAARRGARRFVTVGHSFGGAVAIQVAAALGDMAEGVVTASTQAGGCEPGELLGCPVLHLHGDSDPILPHAASEMVQMLTGGELVVYPGAGHGLVEADAEIHELLGRWIPERFARSS